MYELLPILAIVALGVILLAITGTISYIAGHAHTRRETEALRVALDATDELLDELLERVFRNERMCDHDSTDLADLSRRLREVERSNIPAPRPRQAMAERMPHLRELVLPAPPRLDEVPDWNRGTVTFDRIAARLNLPSTDTGTWLAPGPDIASVTVVGNLRDDDTGRIELPDMTGELAEVKG